MINLIIKQTQDFKIIEEILACHLITYNRTSTITRKCCGTSELDCEDDDDYNDDDDDDDDYNDDDDDDDDANENGGNDYYVELK